MLPIDLLAQADCPPTHFYTPGGARFTIAEEVADLMVDVGYQLDAEERLALCAMYPQKANGDWTGLDSGIVASRQNLKSVCGIGGSLHDTFVQGIDVIWTAHEFKTAAKTLREFQSVIDGTPWLASEVLGFRVGTQDPGFNLRNGARLTLMARTGSAGRGMGGPRLYLDEGLYAEDTMLGALVPTMSAMPNAHMVVMSSPGMKRSKVLRSLRKRGRSGADPYLGWIEWSQEQGSCADPDCRHEPGTDGCWLDDEAAVARVNPAHPRRISLEFIQQERRTLEGALGEYLRERMGVWEDPIGPDDMDPLLPNWLAVIDPMAILPEGASAAWSVDVQWLPPGSSVTPRAWVSAAVQGEGGHPIVQLVHVCDPVDVVGWLDVAARRRPIRGIGVQANGAPASALLPDLRAKFDIPGVDPIVHALTGPQMSQACIMAATATRTGSVSCRRSDELSPGTVLDTALDAAVNGSVAKQLSDGWVPDRRASTVDAAPVTAWINAHYLLMTLPDQGGDPGVWFM